MHIGIMGCGQLARMMALEGWPMGLTFSFLAEPGESTSCVEGLGSVVVREENLTSEALFKALGEPAVVTVEREHVDTALLQSLLPFCQVCPGPKAIEISQHRGREKGFLNDLGIPTAPYQLANCEKSLITAVEQLGTPVIVKTCGDGYDGKGQWKIESTQQLNRLVEEMDEYQELIVEKLIGFDKEVSIIAARSSDGETVVYPITENQHHGGILISSIAPAELASKSLVVDAEHIISKVLKALDYVGVLSIEFFVVGDTLLVNELAPRVHNSGHWTQAGGACSQFENHLRSITGMTLGSPLPSHDTGMVNILGKTVKDSIAAQSQMQIHSYNKAPKPKRKMGHVNVWSQDRQVLVDKITELTLAIYGENIAD